MDGDSLASVEVLPVSLHRGLLPSKTGQLLENSLRASTICRKIHLGLAMALNMLHDGR